MTELPVMDDLQQCGVFPDVDGVNVRAYDDVELLCETKPDGDAASPYEIPIGTKATVLFFGLQSGMSQLEYYWPEGAFGVTYAPLGKLRLHARNEVKYPRFGLTGEQIAYVWDLADHAAHGAWATDLGVVERSRSLFNGDIDEDRKRSLFEELLRLAATDPNHDWEAPILTVKPQSFASDAYEAIRSGSVG